MVRNVASRRRTKLLNVRLGAEDQAMAAELRAGGVGMSELVRDAIRTEYGRRRRRLRARDVEPLLAEIYARHPDPSGPQRERPDSLDRGAVRTAIQRRLRSQAKT
jgi:hypothetical protein